MSKFKATLTSEAVTVVTVCMAAALLGVALGNTEPARATASAKPSSHHSGGNGR